MNTKLKLLSAVLVASLTSAANAGIVTEWSYDNQAGFLAFNGQPGNLAGPVTASGDSASGSTNILDTNFDNVVDINDSSLATQLAWGTPYLPTNPDGKQSSLVIDSAVVGGPGSLVSGGAFANGTSLTHNNWAQKAGSDSLSTAVVLDGLTLKPLRSKIKSY